LRIPPIYVENNLRRHTKISEPSMYNNNINGGAGKGGGGRGTLSSMDFYRRVPKDLTEVSIYIYFLLRLFVRAYDVYVAEMLI